MNHDKIFVHRANFSDEGANPIEQVAQSIRQGYGGVEVDVTVTGDSYYAFCHPSQLRDESVEYHPFDSSLFEKLARLDEDVLFLVDIKYLDDKPIPAKLVETMRASLKERVIFSAAQPELLEMAHNLHARTAQYFRDGVSPGLSFEPDFFILKSTDALDYPPAKTILYCSSLEEAEKCLLAGVSYAMVDDARRGEVSSTTAQSARP